MQWARFSVPVDEMGHLTRLTTNWMHLVQHWPNEDETCVLSNLSIDATPSCTFHLPHVVFVLKKCSQPKSRQMNRMLRDGICLSRARTQLSTCSASSIALNVEWATAVFGNGGNGFELILFVCHERTLHAAAVVVVVVEWLCARLAHGMPCCRMYASCNQSK